MLHKIKWLAYLPAYPFMVLWMYAAGRKHNIQLTLADNARLCFETWLEGYRGK